MLISKVFCDKYQMENMWYHGWTREIKQSWKESDNVIKCNGKQSNNH